MNPSTLPFTPLAAALVLGTTLLPVQAHAAEPAASEATVIAIHDAGLSNLPTQWFPDSIVMPGDSDERTFMVENHRNQNTQVSIKVVLDKGLRDQAILSDLEFYWEGGNAGADSLGSNSPTILELAVLEPGGRTPVKLGYRYQPSNTSPPAAESRSLGFSLSITAQDTAESGDREPEAESPGENQAGGGPDGNDAVHPPRPDAPTPTPESPAESDDGPISSGELPSTGANVGVAAAIGLLLMAMGRWAWVAARRQRREDEGSPEVTLAPTDQS